MRAVFVGASELTVMTVRRVLASGHEAVVIETDAQRIDELREDLDCGFVNDDGSKPSVLEEMGPDVTDVLFCLTNDDQDNIIASLVGRQLGFGRVVTKIDNPDFEPVCRQLGLEDPIVPSREMAGSLLAMLEGHEPPDLSSVLKGGLRFYSFTAAKTHVGKVGDLEFPCEDCRVIAITRDGESVIADAETVIAKDDEVALLTIEEHVAEIDEHFSESD